MGYSQLLINKLIPDDPRHLQAQEILEASRQAAGLTQQLLAFSRKQVLVPKVLDLNTVVTDTVKMLGHLIGEDIQLTTLLDTTLQRVEADPPQMQQVIMNLAVNARDAMPEGGTLSI